MPAIRKNFDTAVAQYTAGASVDAVAAAHHMSRQAMWKVLKRRGVVFRPMRRSGVANHFYRHGRGYTAKQMRAVMLVAKAVKRGKLIPQPCKRCGFAGRAADGRNLVHAHHADYTRPLDVEWLCKHCHDDEHAGADA